MDVDFCIPLKKEDLLKSVKECFSVDLIPFSDAVNCVRDVKHSIEKKGCESIIEKFEVCFSFLYETEDCTLSQLQEFYDDVVEEYMKRLCPFVEDSLGLDPKAKICALNIVKMVCYIFSITLKTFEEKESNQNDNFLAKKSKLKPNKKRLEDNFPWYDKKLEAFSILFSLLQQNICNLWPSKIVEEPFVNLIAGCCFKALENTEINLVKNKALRDSVSQVLSSLIVNYNYTLTFLPRAVDLMKQHEHSAAAIAHTIFILIDEYFSPTILDKLLNELLDVCLEDPQSIGKSAALLISDLGENHPQLFISLIDLLKDYLCVDAYQVRNAVLVTFCEMIINCYSGDKITDDAVPVRNSILRVLQDHITDENAYVRSKVVNLWTKLASSKSIPVAKYPGLLRDMTKRLMDKSMYVSKNAICFFTTALENNPYGGKLRLLEVNKEKEVEMKKLKDLQSNQPLSPEDRWNDVGVALAVSEYFKQENISNGENETQDNDVEISVVLFIIANLINKSLYTDALKCLISSEKVFPESMEIRCNMDHSDQVAYYVAALKKIYLRAAELDPEAIVPDYFENLSKIDSARKVVQFLIECSDFIDSINRASDIIYKLMFSKNVSEIYESIEFFSKAYKFKVENSEKAVRDMLLLVNSNTIELKESVAKAYGCLYLESSKLDSRARSAHIAHRLINLVKGIDNNQKLALEELLKTWFISGQLDKEFILALFERIVQLSQCNDSSENKSLEQISSDCNAALVIIEIIARTDNTNSIVLGNLNHLTTLLNSNLNNYTVKLICTLLKTLGNTKQNNKPLRYKNNNEIFQTVLNILLEKYDIAYSPEFSNLAMSFIDLIFELSYKPEELGNEILLKMYNHLVKTAKCGQDVDSSKYEVIETMLEKLFFVCGHIVFKNWQYYDKDVYNWLKKCHNGIVPEKNPDESLDEFEMDADNIVAADEALYEKITAACGQFLFTEGNLIQHISQLVLSVCQSPDDKVSSALKASASLCLAKFMFVSCNFSEEQFQLYMTLMDRCKHDSVRSNLVLGFGDLLCRFPNTAEPWTPFLYSRLRDTGESVRLNAVSVLCLLISSEMIKVRGQFAELLIHLEDMNPMIVEKVNSLLLDLSRKGNTIYNVIPDIISKLSNPDRPEPVSASTFKLVISRLFELVTKERQSDLLVEKLCARLSESTSERQWEDYAYCLSQIRYSEKSLRKLMEAFPNFTERLLFPPVHDTINTIISTCAKSSKPSLKDLAHEAMDKLDEILKAKDGEETLQSKEMKNLSTNQEENSPDSNDSNETCKEIDEENDKEMKTPARPPPRTTRHTSVVKVTRSQRKNKKECNTDSEDSNETTHEIDKEIKTPARPSSKATRVNASKGTATKLTRAQRNKVSVPPESQSVTRSTRKKKATKYVSSDEED